MFLVWGSDRFALVDFSGNPLQFGRILGSFDELRNRNSRDGRDFSSHTTLAILASDRFCLRDLFYFLRREDFLALFFFFLGVGDSSAKAAWAAARRAMGTRKGEQLT